MFTQQARTWCLFFTCCWKKISKLAASYLPRSLHTSRQTPALYSRVKPKVRPPLSPRLCLNPRSTCFLKVCSLFCAWWYRVIDVLSPKVGWTHCVPLCNCLVVCSGLGWGSLVLIVCPLIGRVNTLIRSCLLCEQLSGQGVTNKTCWFLLQFVGAEAVGVWCNYIQFGIMIWCMQSQSRGTENENICT